jgi:hypothetical protein
MRATALVAASLPAVSLQAGPPAALLPQGVVLQTLLDQAQCGMSFESLCKIFRLLFL